MDDTPSVPVARAWRPAASNAGRAAALAQRLGLTTAQATTVLVYDASAQAGFAGAIAAAIRTAHPAPTRPEPVARFAAAHPNPPGTSPYSGAALQRTIRTMGRTDLPLPHAWARVRGQLEDERGGQSAAAAFHLEGTTFVVVHDSCRAPLDPAGMRTVYAWDSTADGPAMGRGDDPDPPGRKVEG